MNIELIIQFIKDLLKGMAKAAEAAEDKVPGRMYIKDVDMIKKSEGLRLVAYLPTPNDVWTIGYGHTKTATEGMKITKKGAVLLHDVKKSVNSF